MKSAVARLVARGTFVDVADAKQGADVRIVGLHRQWVDEEEYGVYRARGDARRDLRVTAFVSAENLFDRESHFVAQQLSRVASPDELEACEATPVERRPGDQVDFPVVVRDERESSVHWGNSSDKEGATPMPPEGAGHVRDLQGKSRRLDVTLLRQAALWDKLPRKSARPRVFSTSRSRADRIR
jgi:hypothetical protein